MFSAVENQAAYLIDLFINNKIETFLKDKESEATLNADKNATWLYSNLRSQFERNIYHSRSNCESMYRDYDGIEIFFKNTGLFGTNLIQKKYYILKHDFLTKLGLRLCNSCYDKEDKLRTSLWEKEIKEGIRVANSPESWEQRSRVLITNWENLSKEDVQLAKMELKKFQQSLSELHSHKSFTECDVIGFTNYGSGTMSLQLSTGYIVLITSLINDKRSYRVMQKQFNILDFRG